MNKYKPLLKLIWNRKKEISKYLKIYGIKGSIHLLRSRTPIISNRFTTSQEIPNVQVLFVTADTTSPSHEYRVLNPIRMLSRLGVTSSWVGLQEAKIHRKLPIDVEKVIFWRIAISPEEILWISDAQNRGIQLIYDTDDLIFERQHYTKDLVPGLSNVPKNVADFLTGEAITLQEKLIRICDFGIGSTQGIVDGFARLGLTGIVIPNMPTDNQSKFAQGFLTKNQSSKMIVLGYSSGTKTHQKDFEQIKDVIWLLLRKHKNTQLLIIGEEPFDKAEVPGDLRNQIKVRPLVPHEKLLSEIGKFDINLAPVDTNTEFSRAKSAIRYIHAGILGIPTIASTTPPFLQEIQDGENGFLPENTEDWQVMIEKLLNDKYLRKKMGQQARSEIENKYGNQNGTKYWQNFMNQKSKIRTEIIGNPPQQDVVFVVPGLPVASGGTRMIFVIAQGLAKRGMSVGLSFPFASVKLEKSEYKLDGLKLVNDVYEIENYKYVISNHYNTIPVALQNAHKDSKIFNLVQDYEAMFFPMGEEYLEVLKNFLSTELVTVSLGQWNADILTRFHSLRPEHIFDLPLDTELFSCKSDSVPDLDLLVHIKSEAPRRLSNLALNVIRHLRTLPGGETLNIATYGHIEKIDSNKQLQLETLGVVQREKLPQLYRRARVGLAFSPTNTSLLGLEMNLCGVDVIDIQTPFSDKTYLNHEGIHQIPNNINMISGAVLKFINLQKNYPGRRNIISAETVSSYPTEAELIKKFISIFK